MSTETHEFQAEVKQILDLMIHSLYTNKDVFLRELVSNASDALDRRRFAGLTEPALLPSGEFAIRLVADGKARTLRIEDNGVERIEFTNTTYSATGLSLTSFGSVFLIDAGQFASMTGTQTQFDDSGAFVAGGSFGALNALVTGSCLEAAASFTCGFTFGALGFSLDLGSPGSEEERFFRHTANVVTPEPTAGLLLGCGLVVLRMLRRRAASDFRSAKSSKIR